MSGADGLTNPVISIGAQTGNSALNIVVTGASASSGSATISWATPLTASLAVGSPVTVTGNGVYDVSSVAITASTTTSVTYPCAAATGSVVGGLATFYPNPTSVVSTTGSPILTFNWPSHGFSPANVTAQTPTFIYCVDGPTIAGIALNGYYQITSVPDGDHVIVTSAPFNANANATVTYSGYSQIVTPPSDLEISHNSLVDCASVGQGLIQIQGINIRVSNNDIALSSGASVGNYLAIVQYSGINGQRAGVVSLNSGPGGTGSVSAGNNRVCWNQYEPAPAVLDADDTTGIISTGLLSGSVTATGSTTARTLANWLGDTVNVMGFGAVGDGTTDDTLAFVNALSRLSAVGGGQLVMPGRAFVVNTTLLIPSYVNIVGVPGKTKIIYGTSFDIGAEFSVYGCALMTNANNPSAVSGYAQPVAGTVLDNNIYFYGVTFDLTNTHSPFIQGGYSEGESKSVFLRCVRDFAFDACTFIWGGSGPATTGCIRGNYSNCNAVGQLNAGYDNWAASTNFRMVGCTFTQRYEPFTIIGTTTSGSPTITGISDTSKLVDGVIVNGTGIPQGSSITNATSNSISINVNASASGTVTLICAYNCPAVNWNGLPGWTGGVSDGLDIVGCQFEGMIGLDTLATNCSAANISITGGKVQGAIPIVGRGQISNTRIIGVSITQTVNTGGPAIWIDQGATAGGGYTGNPSSTHLHGNILSTVNVASSNGGAMRLYGGGVISDNELQAGTFTVSLQLLAGTWTGNGNNLYPGSIYAIEGTLLSSYP